MGSGKSKLLREIVKHFATPEIFVSERILPIHLTFKEFMEGHNTKIKGVLNANISPEIFELIKDNSKIILLLDGLDEIDLSLELSISTLQDLDQQLSEFKNLKLIVTSRFIDGFSDSDIDKMDIKVFQLGSLSLNKTIEFLQDLCVHLNLKNRIIEDLKRSTLFRELPRSPIAAILLAQLLNDNSEDIPANMTELYSKYVELSLGRWDIEKGLQSQKEYQVLDNVMMEIAKIMLDNNLIEISFGDVKHFFSSYLKERNLSINPDHLFNRIKKRCEIFYTNEEKQVLSFKHKTFTEFLYAKHMFKNNALTIDSRAFHPYWTNTIFFTIGLYKDCPEFIKELTNYKPLSDGQSWIKVVNMSNYLLASYTSPYRVVEDAIAQTVIDAAMLYKRVISGESRNPFGQMTPMSILYILQLLIRDAYSYVFFKPAIQTAALTVDESQNPDDIKAYAIFFLDVMGIELGEANQFEFLLDNYANKMPLDLTMAIYCESKNLSDRSKIIRKQLHRVKDMLKGNKSIQSRVKALFENPISEKKGVLK